MEDNKEKLISRRIRKFNEDNWFQWGAPRNIKTMKNNLNQNCIYVRNLTRKDIVAFKSNVHYFGGRLLMLLPKNEDIDLDNIVNYLNSNDFKKNYMYSNRFKIGQKQLINGIVRV